MGDLQVTWKVSIYYNHYIYRWEGGKVGDLQVTWKVSIYYNHYIYRWEGEGGQPTGHVEGEYIL